MKRSTEIKLEWFMRRLFNSIYGTTGAICVFLGVVVVVVAILSLFW